MGHQDVVLAAIGWRFSMMVWVFAMLAFIGFVLAVPFWKVDTGTGVTGGPVANYVGLPLVVIGLIGLLWYYFYFM
jgi:hypothetical protein